MHWWVSSALVGYHEYIRVLPSILPPVMRDFYRDLDNSLGDQSTYTPLVKLLAWQARPGMTQDGRGNKADNYPYQQQFSMN